jgi:hypothetical protein
MGVPCVLYSQAWADVLIQTPIFLFLCAMPINHRFFFALLCSIFSGLGWCFDTNSDFSFLVCNADKSSILFCTPVFYILRLGLMFWYKLWLFFYCVQCQ